MVGNAPSWVVEDAPELQAASAHSVVFAMLDPQRQRAPFRAAMSGAEYAHLIRKPLQAGQRDRVPRT